MKRLLKILEFLDRTDPELILPIAALVAAIILAVSIYLS